MNIQTCKLISLNAKYHLHVQHLTNAQNMYASRNKILLGHKSHVHKVMHDKTTSTKLQGIGTNHKSLQNTEYKLIYIYIYEPTYHTFQKNLKISMSLDQTINQSIVNQNIQSIITTSTT